MSISRFEQETSIVYNQEDKTAFIYTHHPALIRKLDKGCEMYPDTYKFVSENTVGGRSYIIPKKNVRVGLPIIRTMSEDQKLKAAERMKKLHLQK